MRAFLVTVAAALDWPQVLTGVLKGADLTAELSCVSKVAGDAGQLAAGVALLEKRDPADIQAGLADLGAALSGVPDAIKACNATAVDVAKAVLFVEKLKDPKFAKQSAIVVGENLLLNGAAIGQEIIQADADAKANQSAAFGADVGAILAKVFGPRPELHKPDWPKVAVGVLAGFAGFEGTADQLCLRAAASEEASLNSAVQLLKEGTARDALKGLELVADALKATPQTIQDCKNATQDAKAEAEKLATALALMKHPIKFAYHVGKDIVVNGKDILHELEGASEAYEAQNWAGFGAGLGEALAKLLVGDVEAATEELAAEACAWPAVLLGVLDGAGFRVETQCVEDGAHAAQDLAGAVRLLAKKTKADVEAALLQLKAALAEAPAALKACRAADSDVEALEALLKTLGSPGSVAIDVGENIVLNGVAIYGEVEAAAADRAAGRCGALGEDVGTILGKVFLDRAAASIVV